MRFALFAALLPVTVLAAPCSEDLIKWSTAIVKSIEWFEGGKPFPSEQLIAHSHSHGGSGEGKTIWGVLNDRDDFSELVKIIKRDEKYIKRLDNKDLSLTFFAPNNEAIEKVRRGHQTPYGGVFDKDRRGGNDDHKDKWVRQYIHDALQYATLPRVVEYQEFGQNSTYATELHADDGSFGGNRRRVKVESSGRQPMKVTLNNYAVITEKDISAANGLIHKLDTPLQPPMDITDTLFLNPSEFSTTLAALEKIALKDRYQYNSDFGKDWNKKHPNDRRGKGYAATTFFAPTNEAWNRMPQDLQMYLFSPCGETALRKLLGYHTIPDRLVFSEFYDRVDDRKREFEIDFGEDDDMSFEWEHQFQSLTDQKLPVRARKYRSSGGQSNQYNVEVEAHGMQTRNMDTVAQNGAIHILDDVMSPRRKEGVDRNQNQKDWNEWKEWLPDWSKRTEDES